MITKALEIQGWMSEEELEFLADIAFKSKVIIEVGSHLGRSTRALADNCSGKIYAIDPWDGPYYSNDYSRILYSSNNAIYERFLQNLDEHIKSGKVIPVRGTFENFDLEEPDFIFIDGDHHYKEVFSDIMKAIKILKPGGIISGHDYIYADWPGVKRAVDEILGDTINITGSIWWRKM